jgi:hypothetical protein
LRTLKQKDRPKAVSVALNNELRLSRERGLAAAHPAEQSAKREDRTG